MSLKRLKYEMGHCTKHLPPLVELEDQLIYNILYSGGESYNVRILLAELLQEPIPATTDCLKQTIMGINQFYKNGGAIKRSMCKPNKRY